MGFKDGLAPSDEDGNMTDALEGDGATASLDKWDVLENCFFNRAAVMFDDWDVGGVGFDDGPAA